jgi:hypothetical protein
LRTVPFTRLPLRSPAHASTCPRTIAARPLSICPLGATSSASGQYSSP